jgi:hypothetical protein
MAFATSTVHLNMLYHEEFETELPEAYERLLLDVLRGDRSLFIQRQELAAAWAVVTPLLQRIETEKIAPQTYPTEVPDPRRNITCRLSLYTTRRNSARQTLSSTSCATTWATVPGTTRVRKTTPTNTASPTKRRPHPLSSCWPAGQPPLAIYKRVAEHPPRPVHPAAYLMLSDDRFVPHDDPRSNYGNIVPMAEQLGLPTERFVHADTGGDLNAAVSGFDDRIRALGKRSAIFGLGVLGIGADGHTASLFSPDSVPAPR